MPLKVMSLKTADKIVDLYSSLLVNIENLRQYSKYGYSDLQGYDVVDISNAMKLIIAYRYFNKEKIDDTDKYVAAASSALTAFSFHFYPDNIAQKLKQIDINDEKEAIIAYSKLTSNNGELDMYELLNSHETPGSFFKYCISVGNTNPNFWGSIYTRIGIDKDI